MKKIFTLLACVLCLFTALPVIAEDSEISNHLKNFTETTTDMIPDDTVGLTVWPDAWIGKFLPSIPPHWGAGLSFSGTITDMSELSDAADAILAKMPADSNISFNIPDKIFMPTFAVSARLGGFGLPLDMGAFAFYTFPDQINKLSFDDFDGKMDYLSFGFDVRYAIMEGNAVLPKISIGLGYMFTRNNLDTSVSKSYAGKYTPEGGSEITGTVNADADLGFKFYTNTIYLQAQVSKTILIITPFAGARVLFTAYDSSYDYNYNSYITPSGGSSTTIAADKASDSYTSEGMDFFTGIQPQVYGGLGINAAFVQFSLSASYNFRAKLFSAGFSTRFKM